MAELPGTGAISGENLESMNGVRGWLWAQNESLIIIHSTRLIVTM